MGLNDLHAGSISVGACGLRVISDFKRVNPANALFACSVAIPPFAFFVFFGGHKLGTFQDFLGTFWDHLKTIKGYEIQIHAGKNSK
jgi:hypothetical protein